MKYFLPKKVKSAFNKANVTAQDVLQSNDKLLQLIEFLDTEVNRELQCLKHSSNRNLKVSKKPKK